MFTTNNLTQNENIQLASEIKLVAPQDTPIVTYLMNTGKVSSIGSKFSNWREIELDSNVTGLEQVEGFDVTSFQKSGRAELHNVCSLISKATSVSGTAQASSIEGVSSIFNEEINRRLIELKIALEKAVINSTYNDGSTTPNIRKMKGLLEFVPTAQQIAGTFGTTAVRDMAKELWNHGLGANGFIMVVNSDVKDIIDSFYAGSYNYNHQTNNFGLVVNTLNSSYGNISIILDRHMPADKALIFDPDFVELQFLRQPQFEMLAKTGDNMKGMVLTEATIKVASPKALVSFDVTP